MATLRKCQGAAGVLSQLPPPWTPMGPGPPGPVQRRSRTPSPASAALSGPVNSPDDAPTKTPTTAHVQLRSVSASEDRKLRERIRRTTLSSSYYMLHGGAGSLSRPRADEVGAGLRQVAPSDGASRGVGISPTRRIDGGDDLSRSGLPGGAVRAAGRHGGVGGGGGGNTAASPLAVRKGSQLQLWKLETKDFVRESDMESFGSVSDEETSGDQLVEALGPLVTDSPSTTAIRFREQPMFSTKAHVFHIDPKTKRSWIPASSHAVAVSFFYDSSRNLYRIISVEGNKAVINSTITPTMTFTKTSQKFGQWSDLRANTVYGLGFQTEPDLNQFIGKFQEVKEKTCASQQAQLQKGTANGAPPGSGGSPSSTLVRGVQGAPTATASQAPPQAPHLGQHPGVSLATTGLDASGPAEDSPKHKVSAAQASVQTATTSVASAAPTAAATTTLSSSSSSIGTVGGGGGQSTNHLPQSTVEAQLRYENDRLKLALAQSSANAKKWEVELQTLKNNNARLTGALQESTANVEEWKRQLHALKDENTKMRCRVLEVEASHGDQDALSELGRELAALRLRNENLDAELRQKDKEMDSIRMALQSGSGQQQSERLKALLTENDSLRQSVSRLQEQLEAQLRASGAATPGIASSRQPALEQISVRLGNQVSELRDLHAELAALVLSAPPPPPPPPQQQQQQQLAGAVAAGAQASASSGTSGPS